MLRGRLAGALRLFYINIILYISNSNRSNRVTLFENLGEIQYLEKLPQKFFCGNMKKLAKLK